MELFENGLQRERAVFVDVHERLMRRIVRKEVRLNGQGALVGAATRPRSTGSIAAREDIPVRSSARWCRVRRRWIAVTRNSDRISARRLVRNGGLEQLRRLLTRRSCATSNTCAMPSDVDPVWLKAHIEDT